MKTLFTIILICVAQITFSQNTVIINKNKKNAVLFDDSSPNSLLALLKFGEDNLGHFDIGGMSDSLVQSLSSQ